MGIIASVFCMFDANAVIRPCPEGCFCLNSGQFEDRSYTGYYDTNCHNSVGRPLCDAFDRVIIWPFGKGHVQHVASATFPEPVVLILLVGQVLAGFGFASEEKVEFLLGVLDRVARALHGAFRQHSVKGATKGEIGRAHV